MPMYMKQIPDFHDKNCINLEKYKNTNKLHRENNCSLSNIKIMTKWTQKRKQTQIK